MRGIDYEIVELIANELTKYRLAPYITIIRRETYGKTVYDRRQSFWKEI